MELGEAVARFCHRRELNVVPATLVSAFSTVIVRLREGFA
jgi:hypothetical protein